MSQKRFLKIRDFEKTQRYKDRNPLWIKLDCAIIDDYIFAQLSDETKYHAVALMILASRLNNSFPEDELWLSQQINSNTKINLNILLEIGFLEVIKGSRKNSKIAFNDCKSNKIIDNFGAQKRREEKREEEKTKEHTTTEQTHGERTDAENRVVVGDFSKSFQTESANQNGEAAIFNKSNSARGDSGHLSRFTLADCLKYAQASDGVKNPNALASSLYRSGNADAFIMAMLYPRDALAAERETFGAPVSFTNEPCVVCFGAKMADADGQGYRKCEHCRDERGRSTGLEPRKE